MKNPKENLYLQWIINSLAEGCNGRILVSVDCPYN